MRIPERPIIPGFHPDPSICRVGEDYFLVNSSFEYSPGVPIFRSRDLRSWSPVGHVLTAPDQLRVTGSRHSGGIYAPTLRHHDGLFWMITTNVSDGPGQILVTAPAPEGPWSDVVRIPDARGIDPDLAWDEDGTCWLSWSGEEPAGTQGILQAQLDTSTGRLLTEPQVVWRGTGGQFPEGPHLYQHEGRWYLLIAEGGTERGHAVTIARAPAPSGPFEPSPQNPFLTARGTDWPVQNTGHADLVERADGSWAVVFLGVRPQGSTPAWHVLGRETFAAEVTWEDGWPILAGPIEPPTSSRVVETLGDEELPHSWVAASEHLPDVLRRRDGRWQLSGSPDHPVFAGRRQEHFVTCTRAELDPVDGVGALEIRIDPFHRVSVEVDGQVVRAVATIGDVQAVLGSVEPVGRTVLELGTQRSPHQVGTPRQGPDVIIARVHDSRGTHELGQIDGRYLSTEVAGGFTGRFVGVRASAETTLRSFSYDGADAEDE